MNSRRKYEQWVRGLTELGHRGSATDREHLAAEYLERELREIGIEATKEAFHGCRSWGGRLLLHIAVAAVGACFLWRVPLATILLGLIALFSMEAEQTTRFTVLSRPLIRSLSYNVVARIPSSAARYRLILCGHYDTQKAGWLWAVHKPLTVLSARLPPALKTPLWSLRLALFGQVLVGAALLWGGVHPALSAAGALILATYGVYALLMGQWAAGPLVPGAADNASGAAAVLSLGESWLRDGGEEAELVLLLCGSEETGLFGSSAWLDRHAAELRDLPTWFLNLDGLACGPPRFLGWEVPLLGRPLPYPEAVLERAKLAAGERGLIDAGPHALPGPTDGRSFLARGIPGLTLVGFQDGPFFPNYHQMSDTFENMDLDAAWAGVEFARVMMRRIGDGGSPQSEERCRA